MGAIQFPYQKRAIFYKFKEIKEFRVGVPRCAAQGIPKIDAEIMKKGHFRMETRYQVFSRRKPSSTSDKGSFVRVIAVGELDPDFAERIMERPGGEEIRRCYACGTCSMSCPVREVNEAFNPRRLIRMCLLGMKREVLQSDFVWLCSNCYACQERCPQGIHIAELMCVLKNMAFEYGNVPQGVQTQKERIAGMGRIYEISEFDNKKRLKLDLPELPTSNEDVGALLRGE